MVVIDDGKVHFFMDGYLKENLETAKKVIKNDWDMLFLVDGAEGSGKSVLAMQCAYYVDSTITLDRVTFTPDEFKAAIAKATPGQSVIYDEGFTGLNSKGTMTQVNRTIVQMLSEIRQKNLFVFIVMPTFFDLDRYPALWRSRALLHIYTAEQFQRGYFAFYNVDKKKELYVLGKKLYSYKNPKPNFIGRFPNAYVMKEEEYRKKKKDSIQKSLESEFSNRRYDGLLGRYSEMLRIALVILNRQYTFHRLEELFFKEGFDISYRQLNNLMMDANGK